VSPVNRFDRSYITGVSISLVERRGGSEAVNAAELGDWVTRYVRAWETNEPADIAGLFTDDARYYTAPFRDPWSGRDKIVAGWIRRKDEPGAWRFRSDVLAATDDVGFVRGWTEYPGEGEGYSNLWVIRLQPDGRCSEFIEWWMKHPEQKASEPS
jgi:SnoaL-like domain